jgi:hypothetical protein
MFVFIVILFVLVKSSFAYHCIELEGSHILDCSRLGISTFPRYTRQKWVEVLILERNNFTLVNLSAIMVDFPNIKYIDIRHNPLDCTRLLRVKIDIASDCSHHTFKPTALAITSTTHCGSISVLSPAAPRTSHVKTVTPSSASVSTLLLQTSRPLLRSEPVRIISH